MATITIFVIRGHFVNVSKYIGSEMKLSLGHNNIHRQNTELQGMAV
jgi:hypothetical protein